MALANLSLGALQMVAQVAETNTVACQWGEAVAGFQMAVSVDETNGIIHCFIRNATTKSTELSKF